jgi:hypothetical protein
MKRSKHSHDPQNDDAETYSQTNPSESSHSSSEDENSDERGDVDTDNHNESNDSDRSSDFESTTEKGMIQKKTSSPKTHEDDNRSVISAATASSLKRKNRSSSSKKDRSVRQTHQQRLWDAMNEVDAMTHHPSEGAVTKTPSAPTIAPHPLMPKPPKPKAEKSATNSAFNLLQFNFMKMRKDSNVYIVGKRNSGKNVYLAHWLQRLCSPYYATIPPMSSLSSASKAREHHRGWVGKIAAFSQTEKYNHFYRDVIGVPETFISTGYDPDFLIRLMRVQKYLAEKLSKSSQKNFKHWLAIIVDDMGFEKALRTDKTLAEIMFCGRQFMVVLYYIAQDSLMANRETRNCYDYVICTRENTVEGQKRLHNNYYGLMKLEQFVPTMVRYTTNYSVLIADNTTNSGSIQEHYSWDKAPTSNFDNRDKRINGGLSTREMITLDYDDYLPFRKFLARRTDLSTGSAALFNRKTLAERFDILDAEMKADLMDFYREQDTFAT